MSRLEHPLSKEELMAYLDGQLQGSEASKVAEHLYGCPDCAAAVADARQLSHQMSAWEVEESPERIAKNVRAELSERAGTTGWWTPGRSWTYGLAGAFATVLLLAFIAIPSLVRSRQAAQELPSAAGAAGGYLPPAALGPAGRQQGSSAATPSGPMVIRTITLRLVTKEFEAARSRIDAVVRQSQGYIDHLTVRADAGSARVLSATVRLPANQADAGLIELKKLGRLMEESQNSSDVTSQYVDLEARLSNARTSQQRLLELLRDRAGNLKDVIEMQREISSVLEGIERMEAQRKDLNNKVQFVTIQVELAEEYHAQLEPPAPSTGTELRNASVDGIRSASDNVVGIVLFLLRYGPVLLIWSVVLGSLTFVVWRLRLRFTRTWN